MSFYTEFSEALNEKAGAWKEKQSNLTKEIEAQKELENKYQQDLDKEMEKGPASIEAAQTSLNLEYAKKRLEKAQEDLKELEGTPLYTLEDYNKECNRIVNAYKVEAYGYRIKLQKAISECLEILNNMEDLAKEADKCDRELQAACSGCGQDVKKDFEHANKKGLYKFIFTKEAIGWRESLADIVRRMK